MNVLFVSSGLRSELGGSALSESALASQLNRHCDVTVLCPQSRLSLDFARKQGLSGVKGFSPSQAWQACHRKDHWLGKIFQQSQVVHLNGHWRWENFFLAKLARQFGLPYVLHPRGMFFVGYRKVRIKKAFNFLLGHSIVKHSARVIVLSRFEIDHLKDYPGGVEKCVVIPNAVIPYPEALPSSEGLPRPVSEPYYLYLGRIEARKNLLFLVSAFSEYLREGGAAGLICMGPVERGYDAHVRAKILELGVGHRVQLVPPVYGPEKWAYMAHALGVVYPSDYEPFGRVPFEAVAAGSYPIVPDESGAAEYLRPFLPESIYRHHDSHDLAQRFRLFEDKDARIHELNAAKKWVATELNWERIASRVMELYEDVVQEDGGRVGGHQI